MIWGKHHMSKKRIIIALGHKDLGMNLPEQYQAVRKKDDQ